MNVLRVAFAITGDGMAAMRSARNLIAAADEAVELELVCFGAGIDLTLANSPTAAELAPFRNTDSGPGGPVRITVSACNNSLLRRGLDARAHPEILVPGAQVVPAAVLRLAQLQRDGWAHLSI